jgi:hypothetical protein
MATTTARLGLTKPGTADPVDINVLNTDLDRLDLYTSTLVCTSSTRPTGTDRFTGLIIYETDTKRNYVWDSVVNNWKLLGDRPWGMGYQTGSGQGFNSGVQAALILTDADAPGTGDNLYGMWNAATKTRLVAPRDGIYVATYNIRWPIDSNAAHSRDAFIVTNASVCIGRCNSPAVAATSAPVTNIVSRAFRMVTNDYVTCEVVQEGVATVVISTGINSTNGSLHMVGEL